MDVPRLDPARLVSPIETFTELVDEALAAIEHPADLDRVERVLAGAVTFAADRPTDEASLIAPLARSLKRYAAGKSSDWVTPRGSLQIVLSAFLGAMPPEFSAFDGDPRAVVALRTAAMETGDTGAHPQPAAQRADPCGLLDRPDGSGRAIPSRRESNAPRLLGVADQVMALLRLAPDRDQRARRRLRSRRRMGCGPALRSGRHEQIGSRSGPRHLCGSPPRGPALRSASTRLATLLGELAAGLDLPPNSCLRHANREGPRCTGGGCAATREIVGIRQGGVRQRAAQPDDATAQEDRCFTTQSLSDPGCLGHLDTYAPGRYGAYRELGCRAVAAASRAAIRAGRARRLHDRRQCLCAAWRTNRWPTV